MPQTVRTSASMYPCPQNFGHCWESGRPCTFSLSSTLIRYAKSGWCFSYSVRAM